MTFYLTKQGELENIINFELKYINDLDIWDGTDVMFKMEDGLLHLYHLYTSYPPLTGIDVLQCIATIANVCNLTIKLKDWSTLRSAYSELYGKTYYAYVLKKPGPYKKKIVNKNDFEKCAIKILSNKNLQIWHSTEKKQINFRDSLIRNVETCQEEKRNSLDCPIAQREMNAVLQENVFMECVYKKDSTSAYDHSEYRINKESINRLLSMPPQQSKAQDKKMYSSICVSTSEVSTYEQIKKSIEDSPTYTRAIQFCLEQADTDTADKIDTEKILKHDLRCIRNTLDFMWKYDCVEKTTADRYFFLNLGIRY